MKKYVYSFEEAKSLDNKTIKLGNKGAQLAEMTSIGLPVPQGFTITTEACNEFYSAGEKWPNGLEKEIEEKIKALEKITGKEFGSAENPLLVSVRSGSYVSMPGMMDTVLNLGLNDSAVEGFREKTNNERLALDSYRRFIHMFGDVVLGMDHEKFEGLLESVKKKSGKKSDVELTVQDLKEVVSIYKKYVKKETGKDFPQEPKEQLYLSINAVFNSWNCKRAKTYRKINHLRDDAGTGVNVQSMVFGNTGESSGTGVGFTRNPATGEKGMYGEFLMNAQGEDVVAGIRTPEPITKLHEVMPKAFDELKKINAILEKHYRDMQDFEFTIENSKLFMLQTRTGKRTAQAAINIAVDMFEEKLISKEEAIMRVKPEQLDQLLHKQIDEKAKKHAEFIAKGLAASPGAATGKVVFDSDKAAEMKEKNPHEKLILVRTETSPEDIAGMNAAQGILTSRGGLTSHAAVVARGMGKSCIVGCGELSVDTRAEKFVSGSLTVREGEIITIDGGTGEVFKGELPLVEPTIGGGFEKIMSWADSFRKLGVRANADTPQDSKKARDFGAEGIGLCRTEHMFFEEKRITAVREMIVANSKEQREMALAKIEPMQKEDFIGIFTAMDGLPVTIRLLDPPLHEFLPKEKRERVKIAQDLGINYAKLKERIASLEEVNPMLGFRGCRLGLVYPEINEMQVRAIIAAACECKKKGVNVLPEIMIPVLQHVNEMKIMRELVDRVAKETIEKKGCELEYHVGVMIELPRACITADKIAEYADFFSFGTNDLTQTTLGFSRDDVGKFIPQYIEMGLMPFDPFQRIDEEGVGELVKMGVERGRKTKKDLKIGICGEHGGEPHSVEFCHKNGLNYVSCSPFRVPTARLAAAHAVINEKKK